MGQSQMPTLKQIRVVFIGEPDSGKSTLIQHFVEEVTGRHITPDTLMHEVHYSDGTDPDGNPDTRTIKCAKVLCHVGEYELCLYDAPGHLEYGEQIMQGVKDAHVIVHIHRDNGGHHDEYIEKLCMSQLGIRGQMQRKPKLNVWSHSNCKDLYYYDVNNRFRFRCFCYNLIDFIREQMNRGYFEPVDVVQEAVGFTKEIIEHSANPIMMFSGGKDSLVGLKLLELAGVLNKVKVLFPKSGYDFPEVEEIIADYEKIFGISITPVDNTCGMTYEKDGAFAMMNAKAETNEKIVREMRPDVMCIQYRASDEGVRSKDYHISPREGYVRFSPVFYFSESNIWRFIHQFKLPYCSLYNRGYRSLGDAPVTLPCMDTCADTNAIIAYIESHPNTTERDGRTGQDKSVPFAMEKLRDKGFF